MMKSESTWDKLLKIKTTGRDASRSDRFRYPYEPTPYLVLERLGNSGLIKKTDVILDYGCGKGRVEFFLSYQIRAKSIGIEYDERIYASALENQKTAISSERVSFLLQKAEDYEVPLEVNRFYFFNPFSVEILQKVMARIIRSYYLKPRKLLLFFYYPSYEYISYLMTVEELEFLDEIDCRDMFDDDSRRERIVIYQISL
ncbi:MAG: methyltransferase domain-containing protein [Clostridiales bacterium]|nr:methyltransferase domain-containing protein [Clostridiales bacterium]